MDIESIRRCCLAFPLATENVQWGYDLCFKIDGKLFAVTPLEPAPVRLSFKASPENFQELCERPGIIPAPYMARAQWVALQELNAIADSQLRELLAESYRLVFERLPRKRQAELQSGTLQFPVKSGSKKTKPERKPGKGAEKSGAKNNAKKVGAKKATKKSVLKAKPAKKKSAKAGRRK
jgi:predicted DNA-binding protein (MmcQ/YjbR family)